MKIFPKLTKKQVIAIIILVFVIAIGMAISSNELENLEKEEKKLKVDMKESMRDFEIITDKLEKMRNSVEK